MGSSVVYIAKITDQPPFNFETSVLSETAVYIHIYTVEMFFFETAIQVHIKPCRHHHLLLHLIEIHQKTQKKLGYRSLSW
jgi:hypothetical protein